MAAPDKEMDPVANQGRATMTRDFSHVAITLNNILIPPEKLSPTPSQLDGLPEDSEMDLRVLGTELIQTAGILLDLPQVTS
jgi:cyclin L